MNSSPKPTAQKHLSSSILLWMRTDQPRQTGMEYWSGPHSKIISSTPGLEEYRQIHLAEKNPGLWPAVDGIETEIPHDRKVDGVAEVTFRSVLSPVLGLQQTKMAFADEVNVFRRTLLYAGPPKSSRWYTSARSGEPVGARALVYLRRRAGVSGREFRRFMSNELVPAIAALATLTELRTQAFLPWAEKTWDTPNVAHDNPADQRFHGSLILGFDTPSSRAAFFSDPELGQLSGLLAPAVSAVHAYDVAEVLTFVRGGEVLEYPTS